jgi:hypothetical protein
MFSENLLTHLNEMTHMLIKTLLLPVFLVLTLVSCGSSTSDPVTITDPNASITNGKIGDITFNASGYIDATNEPCGVNATLVNARRSLKDTGTGNLSKLNGNYVLNGERHVLFGPASAICPSNEFVLVMKINCSLNNNTITCIETDGSSSLTFNISLSNGSGTVQHKNRYVGEGKTQIGESNGSVSSINWK